MSSFFENKVVYIFSPQPWNYLQISKHHYARALARRNEVYFITPPANGSGFDFTLEMVQKGLEVVQYTIPVPWFLRVKFPALYKAILRFYLSRLLRKHLKPADAAFDFGCYQQFDSLDFVTAPHKIFFPVDDFGTLLPEARGADVVLTVSKNIQAKFPEGNCHFINHGLSEEFSGTIAQHNRTWHARDTIRVGCSGNLFIRYLDTSTLMQMVVQNPAIEFHFFGSQEADLSVAWQRQWNDFLNTSANVRLHGMFSPEALARAYDDMDIFLLCYTPDYVNYHGENSHKVLEYLSTGKTLVSSYLSIYAGTKLFEMAQKDNNLSLLSIFKNVISSLPFYNSSERMEARRNFALEHTYEKNILKIAELIKI